MKTLLIPSLLISSLFAVEQNFIEIGGGVINIKDNFSAYETRPSKTLGAPQSKSSALPYLNFYYAKELGQENYVYITSMNGGLNLGSEIETDLGLFDFGLKNDFVGKAWENPFVTNQKKTDVTEFGGYLSWGIPTSENSFTTLKYELSDVDYEKDSTTKTLQRDASRHIVSLENVFEFNKSHTFVTTLKYENYDADGEASSYDKTGIEIFTAHSLSDNLELNLIGNLAHKEYNEINPVFNKKIDSDTIGINTSLTLYEPLEYKNVFTSLKAGYEKEDANHNFYDKSNKYTLFTIGYIF